MLWNISSIPPRHEKAEKSLRNCYEEVRSAQNTVVYWKVQGGNQPAFQKVVLPSARNPFSHRAGSHLPHPQIWHDCSRDPRRGLPDREVVRELHDCAWLSSPTLGLPPQSKSVPSVPVAQKLCSSFVGLELNNRSGRRWHIGSYICHLHTPFRCPVWIRYAASTSLSPCLPQSFLLTPSSVSLKSWVWLSPPPFHSWGNLCLPNTRGQVYGFYSLTEGGSGPKERKGR